MRAGKRSNNKGKTWERAINALLRPIYGEEAIYRGDQRRRGGAGPEEGADCEGTPYWIEAKHEKGGVSVWAALHQARVKKREKGDERPTVVVAKTDKKPAEGRWEPPIAAMELEPFLDLIADHHRLRALYNALDAMDVDIASLPAEVVEAFEEI